MTVGGNLDTIPEVGVPWLRHFHFFMPFFETSPYGNGKYELFMSTFLVIVTNSAASAGDNIGNIR